MDSASRARPTLARAQSEYWKTLEYPGFKRLTCFAFARPNLFTAAEAFAYISVNEFVLLHHSCRTEVRELLGLFWPALPSEQLLSFSRTLLNGPPRRLYPSDVSGQLIAKISNDAIRDRLEAVAATGCALPSEATQFLLEADIPKAAECASDREVDRPFRELPTARIAEALRNGFSPGAKYSQQWTDLATSDSGRAVEVLVNLAALDAWPAEVWAVVLGRAVMLINDRVPDDRIFPLLDLLLRAPESLVVENLQSVALILHFLPRLRVPKADALYWALWDRAFNVARTQGQADWPVETMEAAMKVAVGRLADELFEWARKRLGDGDEKAFWTRLETVCGAGTQGRTARVFAAIRTAWLFENRREWTCVTILPCFNWKSSNEAKLMWKAFTFGATFSAGLWSALRNDFLAVFDNLEHLDHEAVRVFHQLVGRIAVHEPTWLHDDEAQRIVTHAPHIGREQIAWVFWTSLDAVGEKAGSLWRDRIGPWLLACWQLDDSLKAPDTSINLAKHI